MWKINEILKADKYKNVSRANVYKWHGSSTSAERTRTESPVLALNIRITCCDVAFDVVRAPRLHYCLGSTVYNFVICKDIYVKFSVHLENIPY